jgi:membrane protein implicated in regulation of membrane protease activity
MVARPTESPPHAPWRAVVSDAMSIVAWAVAGLVCLIAEAATLTFVVAYFGVGAFAAAAAAGLGAPLWGQGAVFAVVSVALLVFTRRMVLGMIRPPAIPASVNDVIGRGGVVTIGVCNDESTGQIRIGSEFWTARSAPGEPNIPAGANIEVVDIVGVTAFVRPRQLAPAAEAT